MESKPTRQITIIFISLFLLVSFSVTSEPIQLQDTIRVEGLNLKEYRAGVCQREIQTQHAFFDQDNNQIKLISPRFIIYTPQGKPKSILTCEQSKINLQNNLIDILGNIHLQLDNETEFQTSQLFWQTKEKKFYTDAMVRIRRNNNLIEGKGFEADEAFANIQIREFVAMGTPSKTNDFSTVKNMKRDKK